MSSVRAVLFTDVVGSTALAASLGDARADLLRTAHFASMRKVIQNCGGYEVKTIGDAVMAGFDSAVAVVDCAVLMQQAVVHENERSDAALAMRIGISMGEVAERDGDLFGMPVVEAARLCGVAHGGHILTSDVVRQLVGSRSLHQFERGAALELKGLPAPLDTCEVLWSSADVEPDWLPRRLADVSARSCVGRDAELDVLRVAWNAVTGGRRQLALIVGEPGIGKTRLVAELARTAHDAVVAYGWCDQESSAAFLPWVHVLSALERSHPDLVREVLTPAMQGELSRFVPAMSGARSPAGGGDAEMTRLLMFDAVDAFLTAISARQPVLVVLDDLHWADAGSLALIRHLLRSDRVAPLLVVGTYRDTDVNRTQPLAMALADLRREPNVTRLSLGGLGRDSLGALIADRAGHAVSPDFVDVIYGETGGHPFFTEEVLSHLMEAGVVVQDDSGVWVTTAPLSEVGVPEG
ncbi:MAG: AAA family ATPase, partial [Ilumatobacteraceae bacterium]|nr:AAA family ATPase [Ilumatobacteraceae bacterium]